MKAAIAEQVECFYNGEVPAYVRDAGKSFLKIHAGADFLGYQDIKIKISDVAQYYAKEARNITSGCRTIAGLTGDWRQIDALANEALEWFKYINIEGMRKEGKKVGLEPKF